MGIEFFPANPLTLSEEKKRIKEEKRSALDIGHFCLTTG